MKRIWIGIGFLVGLLVVGLVVMQVTDRQMSRISEKLQQAAQISNFEEAVALSQAAQSHWEENSHFMAALCDHTDIDNIEELFAQLNVYQLYNEQTDHAVLCAQLAKALLDLTENHRLTWWNLL